MSGIIGNFNLLDEYRQGNQYAFSFFKLRADYTGSCVQVRRSSDNALMNIGFSVNYLVDD